MELLQVAVYPCAPVFDHPVVEDDAVVPERADTRFDNDAVTDLLPAVVKNNTAVPAKADTRFNEDALKDLRLVERARRGDSQAWGELIERNYQHCLRIALGILRNRDDAEEE